MRRSVLLALALIAVTPFVTSFTDTAGRQATEVARIRAHLQRAADFAARRDVSVLTPVQRAARARALDRLAAYRTRGEFPRNRTDRARTPVFVDDRGVHCAVGHLLAMDGETALVARIAASRNLARVAELADEPELVAWLDRTGLTLEEAARIQPEYSYLYGYSREVHDAGAYHSASFVTSGISVCSAAACFASPPDARGRPPIATFALLAGGLSIGMGIAGVAIGSEPSYATLDFVSGGLALISSAYARRRKLEERPAAISWLPAPAGPNRVALVHAVF